MRFVLFFGFCFGGEFDRDCGRLDAFCLRARLDCGIAMIGWLVRSQSTIILNHMGWLMTPKYGGTEQYIIFIISYVQHTAAVTQNRLVLLI